MKLCKKIYIYIVASFVIILLFLINSNINKQPSYGENTPKEKNIENKINDNEIKECKIRLDSLEPEKSINIDSTPIYDIPLPSNIQSISKVIEKGNEIPLQFAYNDLSWRRPAYKSYWHTTTGGGRWSYVPERVNYALHRIFATYSTASIFFDATGNLGILEESKKFNIDYKQINQIVLIAMQSNVKKIVTLDNQVIVIVEPSKTGLQVLTIPENIIKPSNKNEATIFQMITTEGYEIDYSLINMN